MYSSFQLVKKYLRYLYTASNGKGHGIHSPFVFDFVTKVIGDNKKSDWYPKIETVRNQLLHDNTLITVEDHGAGSLMVASGKRTVKEIARSSLKNKKFAQLLFKMVTHYKPGTIIELGTSLGITTSYLAAGNPLATVYTMEGAKNIASIALNNFKALDIHNIQLTQGNFDTTLPALLKKIQKTDFVFIDGNHRRDPTIEYFNQLLQYCTGQTVLVFDDIHWSKEMEEAWAHIQKNPAVTVTIDLFFIGVLFFNKEFKSKQHFVIRF